MREQTVTTTTGTEGTPGYFSWNVTYNEPENVAEFADLYGGEANLTKALQATLKQAATQNNKTIVAEAAKAYAENPTDENRAKVDAAITKHQETVAGYRPGAPRAGSTDGIRLTQKQRQQFGSAVAAATIENGGTPPNKARMQEIAAELGIDLAALAG